MSIDRLPPYDPGHGLLTRRGGQWVETWNLRNGVAWRDPVLAERAVAAWHDRHAGELREAEVKPVLLQRLVRRIGSARQAAARAWKKDAEDVMPRVGSETGYYPEHQGEEHRVLQQVGS